MNQLLLFPEEEQKPGIFCVQGKRAHHVIKILKVEPHASLHVGLLGGATGLGVIRKIQNNAIELEVELTQPGLARPSTRLIVGVPRPKALRRLIPQLVTFGLDELVLLRTWRVDRSYMASDVLNAETLRLLVLDGLMQACLTHEPKVVVKHRFRPYVEDELAPEPRLGLRWIAHPRATAHIADLDMLTPHAATLVIGPERGFLDEEVHTFENAGFHAARLAGPIMRVDTACIAALAQLELKQAQFSLKLRS